MRILTTMLMVCSAIALFSQTTIIEGYIYESGNRGYLSDVSITAENMTTEEIVYKTKTDEDGAFKVTVPINSMIRIYASKDMFDIKRIETKVGTGKAFLKLEMGRKPGYTFEVTLAEKRSAPDAIVDAISNSRIEIYNNTTQESVMDLKDHDSPTFQLNLEKGNHYTILIRKNGFLSKRMEAKVDVEGCILCFEGVGKVDPGVSDNLTEGNAFGVLLANVELERIFEGKTMEIQNLYYDLGKWKITSSAREELNKVITLMKDNPNLTLELGSHTDSRGKSAANLALSKKRSKSAVNYLIKNGGIAKSRVISKGYGENVLLNKCGNNVKCTEKEHAINRRTELKIVGITNIAEVKSLAQMKKEEQLEKEILGLMDQEQIMAKDEEELKKIIEENKRLGEETTQISIDQPAIEEEEIKEVEILEKKILEEVETTLEDTKINVEEKNTEAIEESLEKINEVKEEAEIIESTIEENKVEEVEIENVEIEKTFEEATTRLNINTSDGIKVIVFSSEQLLSEDHFVYKRHKDLEILENPGRGYYYMVGGFENESKAFEYLNTYIRADKKYRRPFVGKLTNGVLAIVNQ